MRAGLVTSAALHAGLITFALVGLHHAAPLEPEQIESIEVDLVPIEEFSNIRVGSLESEIIETETPSAVDTPTPATLGERTGNTEQDQPAPELTDIPTPAPTVQTAPEPPAVDAPEPEPEPEAETLPEPEPAPEPVAAPEPQPAPQPQPEPEPVLAATPEEPAAAEPVAPQPVIKTASIDQKRAEYKRRQEEEAKRRAAERQVEQQAKAQEAQRISDIINAEQSRGATTGSGGQATTGKPTGQAARLTRAEQDALVAQMRKCWNPPLAALSEPGLTVRLLVDLSRDGAVTRVASLLDGPATQLEQTTGMAAQRAVRACAPYTLPAEKYDEWQQVDVTFDPRDL